MTDKARINSYLKWVPLVLTMLTIVTGIWKFTVTLRDNRVLQKKNLYLAHRLNVLQSAEERKARCYADLCRAVGQLSAHTLHDSAFNKSAEVFQALYYGDARLYLPAQLIEKLERFNFALDEYKKGDNDSPVQLKRAGFTLVTAIVQWQQSCTDKGDHTE
jgi:hypothetical protein